MTKVKTKKTNLRFASIPFTQGKFQLAFFVAKASTLWELLSINRRVEDKDEGYQRTLSPSRVRSIAKYVQSSNPLPLSILVTFDDAKLSSDGKTLFVPKTKDAGWVIDGQHRLAGAHESKTNLEIPVIAFLGLDIHDQINQFVTINREAKGVPTSLYFDLLKYLPTKKAGDYPKERAADIATGLKKEEDSPLYSRIVVTTAPKTGEISLNNFVRKMAPLIQTGKGIFESFTEMEQTGIIRNYFSAIKVVFPKHFSRNDSIFFQTLGFGALMNVLPRVFSLALKHYNGFTVQDISKLLAEIQHFNFDEWYKMGSGSSAEIQAGNDLAEELEKAFETLTDGGHLKL
ncbi:hypothetical protein C0389_05735 [bacterium]|nr:hypothetical protein [bacterium]